MRFAALSFLAVLVSAPLAAQAADSPVRYAVTLRATVSGEIGYERTRTEEECLVTRRGTGASRVIVRSARPTTVRVRRSRSRVVYRPAVVRRVRVDGWFLGGSFVETMRCRPAPIKQSRGTCPAARLPTRSVSFELQRPRRARLAVAATEPGPYQGTACGDPTLWIGSALVRPPDDAPAVVNERALAGGRRERIVVRGLARQVFTIGGEVRANGVTTIRWTLTFRRLR